MKKVLLTSVLFATAAASVQPVFADAKEDAVKARRAYYQVVSFYAGPLFGMAQGKVAYDAQKAQMHADNLKALASMKNGAMWIPGTDNEAMKGKTRALKAIWAADSKIGEAVKAFNDATATLAKVAGNGLNELRPAVAALGQTCGGCHKPYRASRF